MSKNDQRGRSLDRRTGGPAAVRNEKRLRDPIALTMRPVGGDDPSVAELVAFRRQTIDLKSAACSAKSHESEEFQLGLFDVLKHHLQERVCAGLQIMGLSFVALTAIWPADDRDMAEAKLALADRTGALRHRHDLSRLATTDAALARRMRWKRAAFAVPEFMLPPASAAPQSNSLGLSAWPFERWDLTDGLEPCGGLPVSAHTQIADWTGFVQAAPDLDQVLLRARKMFKTCDRLRVLAQRGPGNASELMTASEGARIAGYLAAAQVMIWPIHDQWALATKRAIVELINLRGEIGDPVHQQGAIRHVAADAAWVKSLPPGARDDLNFDWSEMV